MKSDTGDKMIKVTVCFWTDGIASKKGEIEAKRAMTSGYVSLQANPLHGIKSSSVINFNSIAEIGGKIEALLVRGGVNLRPSTRLKNLYSAK